MTELGINSALRQRLVLNHHNKTILKMNKGYPSRIEVRKITKRLDHVV